MWLNICIQSAISEHDWPNALSVCLLPKWTPLNARMGNSPVHSWPLWWFQYQSVTQSNKKAVLSQRWLHIAKCCLFTKQYVAYGEICYFLCSVISQGKVAALERWGGKWNHLSMTHRLTTNYAKNYCNRTLIVKVIVENVVTCFLGARYRHPVWVCWVERRELSRPNASVCLWRAFTVLVNGQPVRDL